jgi:hypothetical protein
MLQTVLESPSPALPKGFSFEMRQFVALLLKKDPVERPPPEILLLSNWLGMHGATSLEASSQNVRNWIENLQRA